MENTNRITKKDFYNGIIDVLLNGDAADTIIPVNSMIAFCQHELELLSRKNSTKNPSKADREKKAENEVLKQEIIDTLINNGTCSISDLKAKSEMLFPLSSSKISALLTQLRNAGVVNRDYDKKTAVFSIA